MIIDKSLQVATAQAVTVSAATTDVIDFGTTNPNTGMSDLLKMVFTVSAAVTAAGAGTVTFSIQDSADNSSFADVAVTAAIGKASLPAGAQVIIPMPVTHRRYVRGYFTIGTGPLTGGTFSAQVVTGIQLNTPAPDAL